MLFLLIPAVLAAAVLLIAYLCFRMAFYSAPRKPLPEGFVDVPTMFSYSFTQT